MRVYTVEYRPNDERRPYGLKKNGETLIAADYLTCMNRLGKAAERFGLEVHTTNRDDVVAVAD